MKKFFALILAASLTLGLTACTGVPEDTATAPSGTEAPTEAAVIPENLTGSFENGVYTNAFAGFSCPLPEGWTMASPEELAQIMSSVTDSISDEEAKQLLETSGSVTVCYGYSADGLQNFNMNVQDVGLIYGTLLDAETIIDTILPDMDNILTSAGYEDLTVEKDTAIFLGAAHPAIRIHASISGIEVYQTQVAYGAGTYVIILTATSYLEDNTQNILDQFAPLES